MDSDCSKIIQIFSQDQIKNRVDELAKKISEDYSSKNLTVLILTNGGIFFGVDLIRFLSIPVRIECIRVSSYGDNSFSSGSPIVFGTLSTDDFRGKEILIVDDIIDTGRTLERICNQIENFGAASVKTCVLLSKPSRREVNFRLDYIGFEIEDDKFVVGYGLDYAGRFRELPYIGTIGV